jgi:hypothetical protein
MTTHPEYTFAKVLRPFPNFETRYQGELVTTPIAFPGTLDPQAVTGAVGYSPNLLGGHPVPMGSRVRIWIPYVFDATVTTQDYYYQINWRLRNQKDFIDAVAQRRPTSDFHLPFPEIGRPDADAVRAFIPGAIDTLLYEQEEPGAGAGIVHMRPQRYLQIVNSASVPLTPSGENGQWQQGVYEDPEDDPTPGGPSYGLLELDAMGDELSIWAFGVGERAWDFAGVDIAFSNTYGTRNGQQSINPHIGIIIQTGISSP